MEGIKYVNLIENGPVVIDIQDVENGCLSVPASRSFVYLLCLTFYKLQVVMLQLLCVWLYLVVLRP